MAGEGGGPRKLPTVWEASLFSYLVTRHTGRAMRLSIESQIAERDGRVVAVLDFRNVAVIDFSCADEVVAKLVDSSQPGADGGGETFYFFRGLDEHHLDPIDSALRRRALAVAAEHAGGKPLVLGTVEESDLDGWRAVHRLGRAAVGEVARDLERPEEEVRGVLRRLHRRRLLLAEEGEYMSFRRAVAEAGAGSGLE